MVSIAVSYDKRGYLAEMHIEGHAGVKGQDGYEVCIAISTLSQAMVVALKNVVDVGFVKIVRKSGYLKFSCKTEKFEDYNAYIYAIISKAFVDSMKDIVRQYNKFVDYKEYSNI